MFTHEFIEMQRILRDCIEEVNKEIYAPLDISTVEAFNKLTSKFDIFAFVRDFTELRIKWINIAEERNVPKFQLFGFFETLFVHLKDIEKYLRKESMTNYWSSVAGLSLYLETNKSCADNALYCLDSPQTDNNGLVSLELQISDVKFSFKYFVNILRALEHACLELSIILNEDNTEIVIDKIESGSLLAKIFGNENILKVLSELLNRVTELCHRTFTKTGKLCQKKEALAEINECAILLEAMRANGIDTEESKNNLSEAIGSLSMDILFIAQSGSGKTMINGRKHDIGEKYSQKFLEAKKPQLLEEFAADDGSKEDEE